MRILLLDVKLDYLNPTRSLLVDALSVAGQVRLFGPGYVSGEVLRQGLISFAHANGPFDVVVATEHIANPSDFTRRGDVAIYQRNYVFRFSVQELKFVADIRRDLQQICVPKVASLMETDVYRLSSAAIDRIDADFDVVLSPFGSQFVRPTRDLVGLVSEHFGADCNDNWFDFVSRQQDKVLPLPHFVADEEFDERGQNLRPYLLSVPGTLYHARAQALDSARSSHIQISPTSVSRVTKAVSALSRPLGYAARTRALTLRRSLFRKEICLSRFSFTCGSALRQPLRKFFEIPAFGAVLLCEPFTGMNELGFIEGVHFRNVSPRLAWQTAALVDESPQEWRTTVIAARELIRGRHSVGARGMQLRESLSAIVERRWRGARWCCGDFRLHD